MLHVRVHQRARVKYGSPVTGRRWPSRYGVGEDAPIERGPKTRRVRLLLPACAGTAVSVGEPGWPVRLRKDGACSFSARARDRQAHSSPYLHEPSGPIVSHGAVTEKAMEEKTYSRGIVLVVFVDCPMCSAISIPVGVLFLRFLCQAWVLDQWLVMPNNNKAACLRVS